jgi:hypothetical protein
MTLSTQEVGLTSGPFMQLEAFNTTRDKEILKVQMEHKVKTVEMLKWHKIHPKAKAQMNIPFLPHDIHVSCEAKVQN